MSPSGSFEVGVSTAYTARGITATGEIHGEASASGGVALRTGSGSAPCRWNGQGWGPAPLVLSGLAPGDQRLDPHDRRRARACWDVTHSPAPATNGPAWPARGEAHEARVWSAAERHRIRSAAVRAEAGPRAWVARTAGAFGADRRRTRSLALRGHFVGGLDRVSGKQSGPRALGQLGIGAGTRQQDGP